MDDPTGNVARLVSCHEDMVSGLLDLRSQVDSTEAGVSTASTTTTPVRTSLRR
ncbi:MAG: hypothetical protein R2704_03130 [Microthrixaceae bacterium]